MLEFGACPRCKSDISAERKKLTPVICDHCGFTVSKDSDRIEQQVEKRVITIMGVLSVMTIASYIQLMNWDKHSLSILPLTVKSVVGLSPSDWEEKAEICMDLKKWDCAEEAYVQTAKAEPSKYMRAGQFQMKRGKYQAAAQSFYSFFQNGGNDLEASYQYAKALAQLGQVEDAVKYFDQVLAARPDVLQVTVVNNYVQLLMQHQRYVQAKVLIEKIRKNGGEAAGSFMESEFRQIEELTTASR